MQLVSSQQREKQKKLSVESVTCKDYFSRQIYDNKFMDKHFILGKSSINP